MNITKIYLVTNCFNDPNKIYIGKTKNCRKSPHKRTFGKQINYDYIDEVNSLNREDWTPVECFWIEQFRQWGFEIQNPNPKGGGGPEFHSIETRSKIGKSNLGRKQPQSFIDKICKPILQYDLEGNFIQEWPSATEYCKSIGIKHDSLLQKCLKGRSKTANGYQWSFKFNNFPLKIESIYINKIKQYSLEGELLKEWNSISEITQNGLGSTILNNYLKTGNKKYNGFLWSIDNNIDITEKINGNSREILQYDLEGNFIQEWESMNKASLYYTNKKTMVSGISKSCKGILKSSHGYKWKYKN